jgi:hypothetical protein
MFEEKKEKFLYNLTDYFERDFEPKNLTILFFAGFVGNTISWLAAIFASDGIGKAFSFLIDFSDKFLHYLLVFPFFFSFLIAFSVCKYLFRKKDRPIVSEKEFLSGYSGHLVKEYFRRISLISAMFAGLNTILLVLSTIWFR